MAVSYDEVEERSLGRESKIASLADSKIDNDLSEQEAIVDTEIAQQGADTDDKLTQDALAVIEQMDIIQDQGGDPMEAYSQLPPVLQNKVSEILNGQQQQEPQQQQESQQQQEPQQQQQEQPQQSLTQQASGIAQL